MEDKENIVGKIMSNLEKQFERELLDIYRTAKKECGYNIVAQLSRQKSKIFIMN